MTEFAPTGPSFNNARAVDKPSVLSLTLVVGTLVLFFGIYTDIPVVVDGGTIPMVSALPGVVILLCWPGSWSLRLPAFAVPASVAFLILSLLSHDSFSVLPLRFNALAQFFYSLVIGYLGSNALFNIGARRIHVFMSFLIPIYGGALLLEIFTPFRDVVLQYMKLYPRAYDFLAIAVRESSMGGYRPKLFTSETSYVAMSVVIMITSYVWTGLSPKRFLWSVLYIAIFAALVRSPIVLLAAPIVAITMICDKTMGRRLKVAQAVTISAVGVILSCALFVAGSDILEARLRKIGSGADYSTTYRTYGSVVVGWRVATEYPLFGIGPGSLDPARDIIIGTQASFGAPEQAILREWRVSVNNAIASSLVYFGFIGSIFVLFAASMFVGQSIRGTKLPIFFAILFLCVSSGSIYTPKFAATFILLVGIAALREGGPAGFVPPLRAPSKDSSIQARPRFIHGSRAQHS